MHLALFVLWALVSVYLVGFRDFLESAFPLLDIATVLAIALQIWFMSLFTKKRYYVVSIIVIQITLSALQTYQPENPLVVSLMDGMDLGSLIGILMGLGVY